MTLGEHAGGILGIDDAIRRLVGILLNVVVEGVDDFAGINTARVVPDQTVVHRRDLDPRLEEVIPSTQEGQLFFQQRGGLSLEGKQRRRNVTVVPVCRANPDGRVRGIRPRLIAEHHVEVVEIARSEQQSVIRRSIVEAGLDAELASATEHGLVDFDQTVVVDRIDVQGHVTLPAATRLGDDADVGVDPVVEEIVDALVERINAGQHAFDPAFCERGPGPIRPVCIGGTRHVARVSGIDRPVAHDDVVVTKRLNARSAERVAGDVSADRGQRQIPRHGAVGLRR